MAGKNTNGTGDVAERFLRLFVGNQRSSGRYDPRRDRAFTEYEPLKLADVKAHLTGTMGAGAVPIQDDNSCTWAAIDIDNHDSDEDIDLAAVDQKIQANKLPLIPCRSKSGGVHVYLFLDSPQPAGRIKALMNGWAAAVGHPGSEIFPKQGMLANGKDGNKQHGNWINLPYMHVAATKRYAMVGGKVLGVEEFVSRAEAMRVGDKALRAMSSADHPDAPPCIQKMYANGVAQGHRNEALYNVVVYLRKASPDGYERLAEDANKSIFSRPLGKSEVSRTIASAGRDAYGYRCNEEPCRSLCDRDSCLKRKFGITPADAERLNAVEAIPPFTDLVKYLTEPVRWEIKIDGLKITNLSTEYLLDWRAMRQVIAERLTKIVPLIKNQEWERILIPLMKQARMVEAPDDSSVTGIIRDRLREFASKTDLTNRGKDLDDRKALMRGMPVVQVYEGDRHVFFRGQDFVNYLKRTRTEELKGVSLWFAVKEVGVAHTRLRAGDHNINVWYLPVKTVLEHRAPVEGPEFKSEL